jgi:hypothetical protein
MAASNWSNAIKPSISCATPTSWVTAGQITSGVDYVYHLATFVSDQDAARNFSATVTFSASNTPS